MTEKMGLLNKHLENFRAKKSLHSDMRSVMARLANKKKKEAKEMENA